MITWSRISMGDDGTVVSTNGGRPASPSERPTVERASGAGLERRAEVVLRDPERLENGRGRGGGFNKPRSADTCAARTACTTGPGLTARTTATTTERQRRRPVGGA